MGPRRNSLSLVVVGLLRNTPLKTLPHHQSHTKDDKWIMGHDVKMEINQNIDKETDGWGKTVK